MLFLITAKFIGVILASFLRGNVLRDFGIDALIAAILKRN